jgi:membrane dipeptidase
MASSLAACRFGPLLAALILLSACGSPDGALTRGRVPEDSAFPAVVSEPRDFSSMPPEAVLAAARELHTRILTLDSHADIPFDYATASVNPCTGASLQVDVPKMRTGGLQAVALSVWVPQAVRTEATYVRARDQAMTKFRAIHRFAEELCPDQVGLALAPEDVERVAASGRLVAIIGIENGFAVGLDPSLVRTYAELGATYMSLTHSAHNDLADSSLPREAFGDGPSEHDGVSALGEQVIREMNRAGMMVDVSHGSKATALEAMRLSRAPVIASHSSVHALTKHARNMDDETLLALKGDGGVIQIVALGDYVRRPGGAPPSVSDLVDHIDYAVELIGIDHVGIASDFDGGGGVAGWNDASETPNVTAELLRRGYSEEEIAKLWGENFLRVWREAERLALGGGR